MISSFYSAFFWQTAWAAVRNVLTSFLAAVAAGRNPAADENAFKRFRVYLKTGNMTNGEGFSA